jgi:hypothetical protein
VVGPAPRQRAERAAHVVIVTGAALPHACAVASVTLLFGASVDRAQRQLAVQPT